MKKEKKGFTLIEILSVMILITLLLGVGIPGITRISTNMKEKSLNTKINLIESAATSWGESNKALLQSENNCLINRETYSCKKITVRDLIEDDYLDSENYNKIEYNNPVNNDSILENCVYIYKKNNRVYTKYFNDEICTVLSKPKFNPLDGIISTEPHEISFDLEIINKNNPSVGKKIIYKIDDGVEKEYNSKLTINTDSTITAKVCNESQTKCSEESKYVAKVVRNDIYLNFIVSDKLKDKYNTTKIENMIKQVEDNTFGYVIDDYNIDYTSLGAEQSYLSTRNVELYSYFNCDSASSNIRYSYEGRLGDYVLLSRKTSSIGRYCYYQGSSSAILLNVKTGDRIDLLSNMNNDYTYCEDRFIYFAIDKTNNYLYVKLAAKGSAATSTNWNRTINSTHYSRIKFDPTNNYKVIGNVEYGYIVVNSDYGLQSISSNFKTLNSGYYNIPGISQYNCYLQRYFREYSGCIMATDSFSDNTVDVLSNNTLSYPTNYKDIYNTHKLLLESKYAGASKYKKGIYTNVTYDSDKNIFYNSDTDENGILLIKVTPDFYTGSECKNGDEEETMDILWYKDVKYRNETMNVPSNIPTGRTYQKTINIIIVDNNLDDKGNNRFIVADDFSSVNANYDKTLTYLGDTNKNVLLNKVGSSIYNLYENKTFNSNIDTLVNTIKNDIINSLD